MSESDAQTELEKAERRICELEYWAREVAQHLYMYHGEIIEPPEPEDEETEGDEDED